MKNCWFKNEEIVYVKKMKKNVSFYENVKKKGEENRKKLYNKI
jgi:hypothetical protein